MRVAILGAGSWGTALAQVLCDRGLDVALWARDPARAEEIARTRRNEPYLPEILIDDAVSVGGDLAETLRGAELAILAVPTHGMRAVVEAAAEGLRGDVVIASAAKGFEVETLDRMSEVVVSVLGEEARRRVVAISGPNIAPEIARGLPAATVVAGAEDVAARVRDTCSGSRLRFYSSEDLAGVEYAGGLKNVVAIAAGLCDGFGVGDNGKAAIVTRGLAEIARLGVAAGAQALTFAGLAGVGDCVVTCFSPLSRNRRLGEAIGRGESLEDATGRSPMVAEGVNACRAALRLAERHHVEMPITREVHAILFEGKAIPDAIADLLARDAAPELRGLRPA